jgi:hypothetical protein
MIDVTKPKNIEALDLEDYEEDGFTDGTVDIGQPLAKQKFNLL